MPMSVERVKRKGGAVWRVRWRDGSGRERSRVLGRKRDAEAFDAEVRRRKRAGDLAVHSAGKETLADFAEKWFELYAAATLARSTLTSYASTWDRHVLPRLGGLPLRDLTPELIQCYAADLRSAGVGPAALRRTLVLLQGVLQRAVEWGHLPANPAKAVRKPSANRKRAVRPLSPLTVEQIRSELIAAGRNGDAVLVSLLAYSGIRPGEALALTWEHVRDRTLLVEQSNSDGEIKSTKTGQRRTVRLLRPLAIDLAELRLASGKRAQAGLVLPNGRGGPWRETDWRNWRKRVYQPAARACGVSGSRPYDLRHSFCSLLIYEGASVVEVARQLGHSPTMTLDTYGHVFEEFEGSERLSAEEQIRRARDKLVSVLCPPAGPNRRGKNKPPAKREADARIRTGDPFITSEVLWPAELRRRAPASIGPLCGPFGRARPRFLHYAGKCSNSRRKPWHGSPLADGYGLSQSFLALH
jgi:integrase